MSTEVKVVRDGVDVASYTLTDDDIEGLEGQDLADSGLEQFLIENVLVDSDDTEDE